MTEKNFIICPIWRAIIQNVGYKPHPWDIAREGTLTGVDDAVRAVRLAMPTIHVQFSDDGQHIRKWSREPFSGGLENFLFDSTLDPESIVNSHPVISTYASCEWNELSEDGKVWVAEIVRETLARVGVSA